MVCRKLFCVEANRLNSVAASFSVPMSCLMNGLGILIQDLESCR
jgi:hypothetical protein